MSGGNNSRNNSLLLGGLGAGILLGAAGVLIGLFIAEKTKQKNKSRREDYVRQSPTENETRSICSSRTGRDTEDDFFSALGSDGDAWQDLDSVEESWEDENNLFLYEDGLMKGDDKDRLKAFNILKGKRSTMSEDPNFLWRFAKAHALMASMCQIKNDAEGKKKNISEGLKLASRALELDNSSADAHKWFAVLTGMEGEYLALREQLQNAVLFKKHVLEAIRLKPGDYSLYYLLGRFKFEIAKLSWFERKVVISMSPEISEFTYKDARDDFLKAEGLNSDLKDNKLLLAKCYINEGSYGAGVRWLESAKAVPAKTAEDDMLDREIMELLKKHGK